jgi:GNAT superfamily N-acetyltransferase
MIRIRSARAGDESALVELVRQFPTPTPSTPEVLAAIFRGKPQDGQSYVFVAEDESGLIGYVSGYRHAAFYAGGDVAWVDEILVLESRRRESIGRLLMAALEERAVADGCKLASLATAGAGPFYSKLGYETKAGYYKRNLRSAEQVIAHGTRSCPSEGEG